uniref:Uncharacterized protein n=1 Tax=Oryza meridionalis TaxID=40149 RepID=A0A0E0E7J7_9ORYZ
MRRKELHGSASAWRNELHGSDSVWKKELQSGDLTRTKELHCGGSAGRKELYGSVALQGGTRPRSSTATGSGGPKPAHHSLWSTPS